MLAAILPYAGIIASGLMGGGMVGMAALGLKSTSIIHGDNQIAYDLKEREIEQQDLYLQMRAQELMYQFQGMSPSQYYEAQKAEAERLHLRELDEQYGYIDYTRNLDREDQTTYFERDMFSDHLDRTFQSNMQADRLQTQVDLQLQEIRQEELEANAYQQEKAFHSTHSILNAYTSKKITTADLNKISFIISELEKMLPQTQLKQSQIALQNQVNTIDDFSWDIIPNP